MSKFLPLCIILGMVNIRTRKQLPAFLATIIFILLSKGKSIFVVLSLNQEVNYGDIISWSFSFIMIAAVIFTLTKYRTEKWMLWMMILFSTTYFLLALYSVFVYLQMFGAQLLLNTQPLMLIMLLNLLIIIISTLAIFSWFNLYRLNEKTNWVY